MKRMREAQRTTVNWIAKRRIRRRWRRRFVRAPQAIITEFIALAAYHPSLRHIRHTACLHVCISDEYWRWYGWWSCYKRRNLEQHRRRALFPEVLLRASKSRRPNTYSWTERPYAEVFRSQALCRYNKPKTHLSLRMCTYIYACPNIGKGFGGGGVGIGEQYGSVECDCRRTGNIGELISADFIYFSASD